MGYFINPTTKGRENNPPIQPKKQPGICEYSRLIFDQKTYLFANVEFPAVYWCVFSRVFVRLDRKKQDINSVGRTFEAVETWQTKTWGTKACSFWCWTVQKCILLCGSLSE